jgi:uncharacterized protein DUF4326
MTKPKRIQSRRTKGWRMPAGAIYVGRPSRYGNPFKVGRDGDAQQCVALYREWVVGKSFDELRGHDLACWCRLVDKDGNPVPSHADVLLELVNR